jgi:hypothetical protein
MLSENPKGPPKEPKKIAQKDPTKKNFLGSGSFTTVIRPKLAMFPLLLSFDAQELNPRCSLLIKAHYRPCFLLTLGVEAYSDPSSPLQVKTLFFVLSFEVYSDPLHLCRFNFVLLPHIPGEIIFDEKKKNGQKY